MAAISLVMLAGLSGCDDDAAEAMAPDGGASRTRGGLLAAVITEGVEIDPDGYTVSLFSESGIQAIDVAATDTAVFDSLGPGPYIVELSGIASNCEFLTGDRFRDARVTSGDTTRVAYNLSCFSTGPLSDRIAFSSDRRGDQEIYAMRSNGSEVVNLSREPGAEDLDPFVSPDGEEIAYVTDRTGSFEIFVMNASGTEKARLTVSGPGEEVSAPAWSPDDSAIAVVPVRDEEGRLGVIELATLPPNRPGATVLPLAPESSVSWSPDLSEIAVSEVSVGDGDIVAVDTLESVRTLTSGPSRDIDPAWSPDGSRIAFATDRDGNFEIYVIDADGANPVNLTQSPGDDIQPAWSPDGTRLAFATDRDGNFEIYVMGADGANPINLTGDPGDDRNPAWSP